MTQSCFKLGDHELALQIVNSHYQLHAFSRFLLPVSPILSILSSAYGSAAGLDTWFFTSCIGFGCIAGRMSRLLPNH